MLDPRGNETRGSQSPSLESSHSQSDKEYVQAVHKKNTVKELLMMRRQRWNCSQDDDSSVHKLKSTKSEALADDASPHLLGPPAPVNSSVAGHFPPAPPEHGHMQQQHVAPPAGLKNTLFHWQIQQEAQRVGGVPPELLNVQDADGDTCLHIAVAQGRRALAYVLAAIMARWGSLDVKEHNGQTALQIAAATNQHFIVHDLLLHGAQVNTRDLWGRSPLHVCAEKGHHLSLQSIWRTLIGQPIDIEMFNYDGLTPLHVAVVSHNAVVKELRSLGDSSSYMAMELVQRRQTYVECIKTLLLMGASCGTRVTAVNCYYTSFLALEEMALFSRSFSFPQDLKIGRTCLHVASEAANVELLNIFLDQPSSLSIVNIKTFGGNTVLHVASSLQNHKSQVEAVKLLMRKGADPGTRNSENELPSQLVAEGPTGEKVRQILRGKYLHA